MDTIYITLAADNNYAQHVAVVMASVMANTKATQVKFYVLSDGITEVKKEKIESTASSNGCGVEIIELSQIKLFDNLFTSGHISRAAYFRLDIANLVPEEVKRIIYMDVDLVVRGDIAELWSTDMQGKALAAVPDYGILSSDRLMKQKANVIGVTRENDYFNSGVLIIDVEKWREYGYAQEVIKLAATGNLPHHDQDALNKVFKNNWQALPLWWNVIPPVFNLFLKLLMNKTYCSNAIEAKQKMCIMHFAGRYKPWEFAKQSCFNNEYYDYLKLTAFADAKMPQPGRNMQGKSLTRALVRLKLADFWCKVLR